MPFLQRHFLKKQKIAWFYIVDWHYSSPRSVEKHSRTGYMKSASLIHFFFTSRCSSCPYLNPLHSIRLVTKSEHQISKQS